MGRVHRKQQARMQHKRQARMKRRDSARMQCGNRLVCSAASGHCAVRQMRARATPIGGGVG